MGIGMAIFIIGVIVLMVYNPGFRKVAFWLGGIGAVGFAVLLAVMFAVEQNDQSKREAAQAAAQAEAVKACGHVPDVLDQAMADSLHETVAKVCEDDKKNAEHTTTVSKMLHGNDNASYFGVVYFRPDYQGGIVTSVQGERIIILKAVHGYDYEWQRQDGVAPRVSYYIQTASGVKGYVETVTPDAGVVCNTSGCRRIGVPEKQTFTVDPSEVVGQSR